MTDLDREEAMLRRNIEETQKKLDRLKEELEEVLKQKAGTTNNKKPAPH